MAKIFKTDKIWLHAIDLNENELAKLDDSEECLITCSLTGNYSVWQLVNGEYKRKLIITDEHINNIFFLYEHLTVEEQ